MYKYKQIIYLPSNCKYLFIEFLLNKYFLCTGNRCDIVINECARNPCSSHHVCFPHPSDLGYICQCPPGKTGPLCDRDKTKICRGATCYEGRFHI